MEFPRDPTALSNDDWGVLSPPQQVIYVPLPFSEGDWIPRGFSSFFQPTGFEIFRPSRGDSRLPKRFQTTRFRSRRLASHIQVTGGKIPLSPMK